MLIPPTDTPTPTTQIAAVIGDPVSHSLSPRLHNAGFNALGLDWTYIACRVPDGKGEEAVTDMRAKGFRGLSVTMPHKAAAARAVDELSPTAAKLGVVNCVRREGDRQPARHVLAHERARAVVKSHHRHARAHHRVSRPRVVRRRGL